MSGLRVEDKVSHEMDSVRISCLGDLLPANTSYTSGKGIWNQIPHLVGHYMIPGNNPFVNSDILICNLEAPLIRNIDGANRPFSGNPDIVRFMKTIGIEVVSLANNHILDHGKEGFLQTREILTDNRFFPIGARKNQISEFILSERKNIKFAFAAFNSIHDHPDENLIAPLEKGIVFNTLEEIRKDKPDYILFSLHWGNEYARYPSPSQVDLAHELIDHGVDAIAGHHPHVVQPVENYNGGIIIYSLGNFLFDMFWSESVRTGMYVDLVFRDRREISYEIHPYYIRSDFTQDYSKKNYVFSEPGRSEKVFNSLKPGSREKYEYAYAREVRIQRFKARIRMKIFLLKNFIALSPASRRNLYENLKNKILNLCKRNWFASW